MYEGTEVITYQPDGTLGIHGLDQEQQALLGFLARYTGATRGCYEDDLKRFRQFLNSVQVPTLLRAQRLHVQLYVRQLEDAGRAAATINRRVGTLRGFYKYACVEDLIIKDPTLGVTTPKIDHDNQYRTWLWPLEYAALLDESRKNPRYHAMVIALGELGLRIGEMCSLNVEDVHHGMGVVYLTFVGKGGKATRVNLTLTAVQAFTEYIGDRTTGPLFLNNEGTRWGQNSVRRMLTTLAQRAGIKRHITPHGLRRTLATTLQLLGTDTGTIQQTMRHKDPRTTLQSYAKAGATRADIGLGQMAMFMAGAGARESS